MIPGLAPLAPLAPSGSGATVLSPGGCPGGRILSTAGGEWVVSGDTK